MTNEKKSVNIIIIPLLIALISGGGTAFAVYTFYQSPQLDLYKTQLNYYQTQLGIMNESLSCQTEQIGIMKQSLIKEVQLDLEVVPRYDWEVSTSGNGSVQLRNTTLTLSRNEETMFNIYVSNVGNSIANLLYWTVTMWTPHGTTSGPMYDIQNIVLAPYSLYNMTYTLTPSQIPNDGEIVLTFSLMSTESTVYEQVRAIFR